MICFLLIMSLLFGCAKQKYFLFVFIFFLWFWLIFLWIVHDFGLLFASVSWVRTRFIKRIRVREAELKRILIHITELNDKCYNPIDNIHGQSS